MGVNFRELCKSSFKNCSKFFPLFKKWGELRKSVNERNVGFCRLSHDWEEGVRKGQCRRRK